MGHILLGAPLLSASGSGVVGLFGSGGVFSLGQTLATLGTAAKVAAPAASAAGTIQQANALEAQGDAQAAALQAQADADAFNAGTDQENAALLRRQTADATARADRERRLRIGANIAGAGGSRVGQPFDILFDNASQEELNLLAIQNDGMLAERSLRSGATLKGSSAKNAKSQISAVRRGTYQSKAATVLSGVNSAIGAF